MEPRRCPRWLEPALWVRFRGSDCKGRMSVRRVEAGMVFALPLKLFVAITVGAAVCWQKKVSPFQDCPPEHLRGAVSCRWQGKCRSV